MLVANNNARGISWFQTIKSVFTGRVMFGFEKQCVEFNQAQATQNAEQTLYFLSSALTLRHRREGLALFMMIDKLAPGRQMQFFRRQLPSILELLKRRFRKSLFEKKSQELYYENDLDSRPDWWD